MDGNKYQQWVLHQHIFIIQETRTCMLLLILDILIKPRNQTSTLNRTKYIGTCKGNTKQSEN